MSPEIHFGRVMHARLCPRRNAFAYPVFFLRIPLSEMSSLNRVIFSVNKWNLFSFHYRDFGDRDGSNPVGWIRGLLRENGVGKADGEIVLQTFPRVLGYVFNPVSFWFCHDASGKLRAVVCEVNNTFGERHNYLLVHEDGRAICPNDNLTAKKVFHVSPFCKVSGIYTFKFRSSERQCYAKIDYDDSSRQVLRTAIFGKAYRFSTWNLTRAFFLYPLMTLMVVLRIHWQAIRLWIRGVPFYSKPLPPQQETTK